MDDPSCPRCGKPLSRRYRGGVTGLCLSCSVATRNKEPWTEDRREARRLEGNPNWSGDDATYSGIHQRNELVRGKASRHRCDTCERQAENWAFIHSGSWSDKFDPWCYRAMCIRCHHKYDGVYDKGWANRCRKR